VCDLHIDRSAHEDVALVYINDPEFDGWTFVLGLDPYLRLVSFAVQPNTLIRDAWKGDLWPCGWPGPPCALALSGSTAPITARGIVRVPVGRLHQMAAAACREAGRVIEGFRFTGDASRAVDDQGLALLAAEYVEALAAGEHAGHVLAERHGVKLARIKQLLHRARQHELLTSAPRGKQGGDLTARARALLEG